MTTTTGATRRSFIQTAGTAISAPLAAAAVAMPAAAAPDGDPSARLDYLEDLDAIGALNREYARHVNAGTPDAASGLFANPSDARIDPDMQGMTPDGFGEHDTISIAPDRQTATARLHCTVHIETAIGPSCPLVEMARQQGGGVVRRTEQRLFENAYVRRDGLWKIERYTSRVI